MKIIEVVMEKKKKYVQTAQHSRPGPDRGARGLGARVGREPAPAADRPHGADAPARARDGELRDGAARRPAHARRPFARLLRRGLISVKCAIGSIGRARDS